MVWQKNGTPDTLTVAGDVATISDLTAAKSNLFLWHKITSGEGSNDMTFNNNTNSVYAFRQSVNGAADGTFVSQADITMGISDTNEDFIIQYFSSVSGEEKLGIGFQCNRRVVGAGNAPFRAEYISKFVPSPDADITRIDMDNLTGAGDYGIDSNLSALADVVPDTVGGWVEIGRTTLGVAGDTITVSGLTDKRYYMVLQSITRSGGLSPDGTRLGNGSADSGNNYATRYSNNGSADVPNTNNNQAIDYTPSVSNDDSFAVQYISNLSGNEKVWHKFRIGRQAVGAGTAPNRSINAAKWVNTSNPLDVFQTTNVADVGNYESGSEAVVLAWDPTDTHTNNFWEELASVEITSSGDNLTTGTITAKKYLWIQTFSKSDGGGNTSGRLTFNDDTASNYGARYSDDGSADATSVSRSDIFNNPTTSTTNVYANYFLINNLADEKLVIINTVFQNTAGAGTAPGRVEVAAKWANTTEQITKVDFDNADGGSFAGGTFLKVWGAN